MLSLSREWWMHLAPKPMHRRREEAELLLRQWCCTEYGAFWLQVASNPEGVIRVHEGQAIPVVHLIGLGGRRLFVAPPSLIRKGHRMVGPDQFISGKGLRDGELAIAPQIRLDLVDDAALLAAAYRGDTALHVAGVTKPSAVFSVPANLLISPRQTPVSSYVLYQHIFGSGASYPDDGFFYVGVTTRSWQERWAEHSRALKRGSPLLFHRTLRDELARGRVTYIHHKIMAVTRDVEALYAAEEALVKGHWEDERRLNMIPGGKSGLRYLREHGLLAEPAIPAPDDRDGLVRSWLDGAPGRRLPSIALTDKWKDEAWAAAQICSRNDRFSVEQVLAIRSLSQCHSAELIAARIGARSVTQVRAIIEGRTYTRVKF
jgi:hypothetical protein